MGCYGIVEEFVTYLYKPIYHEISHVLKFMFGTENNSDVYDLKFFMLDPLTRRIQFMLYLLEIDELEAMFDESYVEYKKRGKYHQHVQNKKRSKKKNFVDVLFCDVLWRCDNGDLATEYIQGTKNWIDVMEKLPEGIELLIVYIIFVYGLKESIMKDLIKRYDKRSILDYYDLDLIENNINRIKEIIARFDAEYELQKRFVFVMSKMSQRDRLTFLNGVFSTNESNEKYIDRLLKCVLDSYINNKSSLIPLLDK